MIQMESDPGYMVDPHFTCFQEYGREGGYYVDLETWVIQRNPGRYELPLGGIL